MLRGLTLGELRAGKERMLVIKETSLGLLNGALPGLIAGLAMFAYATMQGSPHALLLGLSCGSRSSAPASSAASAAR